MRATRALVRLDHFWANIAEIRRHTANGPLLCLAVKADAYGHGIAPIGMAAESAGVDYLAVATVDEGVELRDAGSRLPILLYSLSTPEELATVIEREITPILSDAEQVADVEREARRVGKRVDVHIKVDTGMGRIGCRPDEAVALARTVHDSASLRLSGVSTHFASSDSADESYTKEQIERFEHAISAIRAAGIEPGIVHAANSGAVLEHREAWYDMVRPGILVYGYYPSSEQPRTLDLKPVMQVVSKVVYLKKVETGEAVSYGMTWRASRPTWIGTVPIGYGDGYSRLLSNVARVAIAGRSYPVVGRVCMDQIMVDLGPELTVKRYDEVVVFGYSPGSPGADELAGQCGTISYEITCNVSKRVPRVYLESDPA